MNERGERKEEEGGNSSRANGVYGKNESARVITLSLGASSEREV